MNESRTYLSELNFAIRSRWLRLWWLMLRLLRLRGAGDREPARGVDAAEMGAAI